MTEPIDLLQIKIEKAKAELPEETLYAIAAVDFKKIITEMRGRKGYSFEQLGDLELETELLLCGLLSSDDYPKELEKRMGISSKDAESLVKEMNDLVFKKIREEFIKRTESKKIEIKSERKIVPTVKDVAPKILPSDEAILSSHGIEILKEGEKLPAPSLPPAPRAQVPQAEKLELNTPPKEKVAPHPLLTQKLSTPFQVPTVKSQYSINSTPGKVDEVTSVPTAPTPTSYPPKQDPYRLSPED